jgi:hypothetical protein
MVDHPGDDGAADARRLRRGPGAGERGRALRPDSLIQVSTPAGTQPASGRARQSGQRQRRAARGRLENLPGGGFFTTPGRSPARWSPTADLARRYRRGPARAPHLDFDDARCTRTEGDDEAAAALGQRLDEVTNARCVGQICFERTRAVTSIDPCRT